jgi:hypothetical protein
MEVPFMSGPNLLRLLGFVVVIAFCLAVSGCGTKYDGLTKEEAQPVVTLLDQEALGHAVVDRLEGKKVKDDVLIVRALYRNDDGKRMELMFRLENGKVTGRGFNQFGDDWRNHVDEVLKEFK